MEINSTSPKELKKQVLKTIADVNRALLELQRDNDIIIEFDASNGYVKLKEIRFTGISTS